MNKNVFYLFFLLAFLACQPEEDSDFISKIDVKTELAFKSLVNSEIGYEENDQLIIQVSKKSLMREFKKFMSKSNLKLEVKSLEVVLIDDNNYIRFYSENNKVSTIALFKGKNNRLMMGETVCTSSACATGGGCVPNGLYCTKCQPPGTTPPIKGDCSRTTSGGGTNT